MWIFENVKIIQSQMCSHQKSFSGFNYYLNNKLGLAIVGKKPVWNEYRENFAFLTKL